MAQEGVEQPKPLVPVCGEPMIERLLRIFVDCGATEIVVIVNEWSTAVREHIESLDLPVPLRLVVKTTPSSMHSLHALSPYLRGERFCLTTVDTIFREAEFKKYIRHFAATTDIDGCMAVTPFVDDEKPLWVGVEQQVDADGVGYDSLAVAMQFARHYRGRGGCRADEAEHGRLHDHAGRCLRKAPEQQTEAYEHEPLNE